MENQQYIGQKAVKEYNEVEGNVYITFEDGASDTVTKEQFDELTKDAPYDEGMVRVHKWKPAVREIMAVLLKNDMKLLEKDFVLGRVDATIVENYSKAAAKFFGADHEHNITLSQIHSALQDGATEVAGN